MTLTVSHFLKCVGLAVLTIFLCGCKPREEAPSPSNSSALSEAELSEYRAASERGSNDAMYRLAIYYLFHEQDDKQGWTWMEKSAEAGNADARKTVLDHYASAESPEEKAHGEKLRQKWGAGTSTRED